MQGRSRPFERSQTRALRHENGTASQRTPRQLDLRVRLRLAGRFVFAAGLVQPRGRADFALARGLREVAGLVRRAGTFDVLVDSAPDGFGAGAPTASATICRVASLASVNAASAAFSATRLVVSAASCATDLAAATALRPTWGSWRSIGFPPGFFALEVRTAPTTPPTTAPTMAPRAGTGADERRLAEAGREDLAEEPPEEECDLESMAG